MTMPRSCLLFLHAEPLVPQLMILVAVWTAPPVLQKPFYQDQVTTCWFRGARGFGEQEICVCKHDEGSVWCRWSHRTCGPSEAVSVWSAGSQSWLRAVPDRLLLGQAEPTMIQPICMLCIQITLTENTEDAHHFIDTPFSFF